MTEHDVGGGSRSTTPRGPEHSGPEHSGPEHSDPVHNDPAHSGPDRGSAEPSDPAGPAARPRRPGRRRKAVFFGLAAVVIVAVAAWAVLGSGLFAVRSVTVTGAGA